MDAAVAALLGAAIGAVIPAGVAVFNQRAQAKRDRLKLATEIALADWKMRWEAIGTVGGGHVLPVSAFVAYHVDLLDTLEQGNLDPEALARLSERHSKLEEAIRQDQ